MNAPPSNHRQTWMGRAYLTLKALRSAPEGLSFNQVCAATGRKAAFERQCLAFLEEQGLAALKNDLWSLVSPHAPE